MSDVTEHPVKLGGVHHAAYRCKDAKETVEWYGKVLG
ncbi:MAG TPA: glyoxalase, partial [Erythrobacter sp.]|nr:glyoxalase [Erythrobacter sp.]